MAEFKSIRAVINHIMKIDALLATVFSLLCPVREYERIEQWSCDTVY